VTLRRAQRGDQEACRRLVAGYQDRVFAWLSPRAGGRPDVVEALARATFLQVLRDLGAFAPLGAVRLSAWIEAVAARQPVPDTVDAGAGPSRPVAPPPGFAARVIAERPAPPRRRLVRGPLDTAGLVAGAACAAALVVAVLRGDATPAPTPGVGSVRLTERRTLALAAAGAPGGSVAVAEPGAELGWRAVAGDVRVEQRAGAVFYRAERGGALVIAVAMAEIRTAGGCITVEIDGGARVVVHEGAATVDTPTGRRALVAGDRIALD
jgi:hypothetical protein